MVSLPLAIFQFVKSPEPTMIARGFGTAAVLMLLVVLLFVIARIIGGQTIAKKERARQRREAFGRDTKDFGIGMAQLVRDVTVKLVARARGSVRATRVPAAQVREVPAPAAPASAGARPGSRSVPRTKKRSASFEEYLESYPQARGSRPVAESPTEPAPETGPERTSNPSKRNGKKKNEEPTS